MRTAYHTMLHTVFFLSTSMVDDVPCKDERHIRGSNARRGSDRHSRIGGKTIFNHPLLAFPVSCQCKRERERERERERDPSRCAMVKRRLINKNGRVTGALLVAHSAATTLMKHLLLSTGLPTHVMDLQHETQHTSSSVFPSANNTFHIRVSLVLGSVTNAFALLQSNGTHNENDGGRGVTYKLLYIFIYILEHLG